MTIMDLLFDGQIYPCEKVIPGDPAYREICRKNEELLAGLSAKIDETDLEAVDQLQQSQAKAMDMLAREYFKYGLSLGLQLMQEAYELPYIDPGRETEKRKR